MIACAVGVLLGDPRRGRRTPGAARASAEPTLHSGSFGRDPRVDGEHGVRPSRAGSAEERRRRGPEGERDRVRRRAVDRAGVDGARLFARRRHRLGRRRRRRPGACRAAHLVHPDVPDRGGVLLHEPCRPGRGHDVLLGDPRDGAVRRLDRRLGGDHDGHPRRRLARRRRRALLLPADRRRRRRRLARSRSRRSRARSSW